MVQGSLFFAANQAVLTKSVLPVWPRYVGELVDVQLLQDSDGSGGRADVRAAGRLPHPRAQTDSRGDLGVAADPRAIGALHQLHLLEEPEFPKGKNGKDPSEADLAKYQKDLGKYNRMYEMFSKIMANAHEMKKGIIANMPR